MLEQLFAISPVDGRYASKTAGLREIFSEYGLQKHRTEIELKWLMELAANPKITELPALSRGEGQDKHTHMERAINSIWQGFSEADAIAIKEIEKDMLHDIASLKSWLSAKLNAIGAEEYVPFLHFGCTSEDINNLAYGLMLKKSRDLMLLNLDEICDKLVALSEEHASLAMVARTHGQPASPTTMGKEMAVFAYRLSKQKKTLASLPISGKINGATGNYNTWVLAYPDIDWPAVSKNFVEEQLGLEWNPYTTQIESHDALGELLQTMIRINMILVDLCRDLWGYIALKYFKLKKVDQEVGSSTMPHKINPEKFENAEGNFELASSMASFLAMRLPVSRWQRDLSDSTLQRNLGLVFGHSLLGYKSCLAGLERMAVDAKVIGADLDENWSLLTEAVQTIMRKAKVDDAYKKVKDVVRGEELNAHSYEKLVISSGLDKDTQEKLLKLKPSDYTGLATMLALQIGKHCK